MTKQNEKNLDFLYDLEFKYTSGSGINFDNGKKYYNAKVIAVDYDIGITIVEKENEKQYLCCLNYTDTQGYKEVFYKIIEMIKTGNFNVSELRLVLKSQKMTHHFWPTKESCAFTR